MSNNQELHFHQMLTQNLAGRSTWKAEYRGKPCLAKKIEIQNSTKKDKLAKALRRQVRFSENLLEEHRQTIVLFHEMVEANGFIAFVRDWIEGQTLADYLKKEPIPWKRAGTLIQKIAEVIELAHQRYSILHGDLKPENIIINKENEISIIDWDSMQIINETSSQLNVTMNAEMLGTPYYMAPEQCSGQMITEKTDVYAVGTILYQMLTGRVPFEKVSTLQIWAAKQSQNPRSILVDFPELQLPLELAQLVDESLLMDLNARVPSIHEFLKRLQHSGGVAATPSLPSPISRPMPPRPTASTALSRQEVLADKTPTGNIVLVGHTQAGKTVLAVGLYATNTKEFTVTPQDDITQNFVDNTKSMLDQHVWPSATQGTVADLRFKLLMQGAVRKRAAIVSFKEYGGERVSSKNYYEQIVGKPEGVLLLFNPSTLPKRDAYEINKLVTETKRCLDYLSHLPRKPEIAIVVTASDTLKNSAKDYKPQFEKLLSEITNTLTLSRFRWKRFEVAVCQPLEDPLHPVLDPQHIQDPFVWLLDKKQNAKNRSLAIYWGLRAIAVLLVIWVCVWGYGRWERSYSEKLQQEIAKIEVKYTSATSVEKKQSYYDELDTLCRNTREVSLWSREKNEAYQKQKERLEQKTDEVHADLLQTQLNGIRHSDFPIKEFKDVNGAIDLWNPRLQKNVALKNTLRQNLEKLIPEMVQICVPWVLKSKNINEMEERSEIVLEFTKLYNKSYPELRTMFSTQIAPLRKESLKKRISTFSSGSEELGSLIKDCKKYVVEDCLESFPESDLARELVVLCTKLIDREKKIIEKNVGDVTTAYQGVDVTKINGYFDIVKGAGFSASDVKVIEQGIAEWKSTVASKRSEAENQIVNAFLLEIMYSSAEDALNSLKGWIMENGGKLQAKNLRIAEDRVLAMVDRRLGELKGDCLNNAEEKYYTKLKEFCASIRATRSETIRNSNAFAFANRYTNWLENESTLTVQLVGIDASCSYTHGGYIYKINGDEIAKRLYYNNLQRIYYRGYEKKLRPWEIYTVSVAAYIDDGVFSDTGDTWSLSFRPYSSKETRSRSYTLSEVRTTLNLVFEIKDGLTLNDIWDEFF